MARGGPRRGEHEIQGGLVAMSRAIQVDPEDLVAGKVLVAGEALGDLLRRRRRLRDETVDLLPVEEKVSLGEEDGGTMVAATDRVLHVLLHFRAKEERVSM